MRKSRRENGERGAPAVARGPDLPCSHRLLLLNTIPKGIILANCSRQDRTISDRGAAGPGLREGGSPHIAKRPECGVQNLDALRALMMARPRTRHVCSHATPKASAYGRTGGRDGARRSARHRGCPTQTCTRGFVTEPPNSCCRSGARKTRKRFTIKCENSNT
jgi:hypothetical protein